jgi:hypothetical protein
VSAATPPGPYATEAQALAAPLPRAVAGLHDAGRVRSGDPDRTVHTTKLAALTGACEAAGVELGDFDRRIVGWLAGYEPATVQVLIGLIGRAHTAGQRAAPAALEALLEGALAQATPVPVERCACGVLVADHRGDGWREAGACGFLVAFAPAADSVVCLGTADAPCGHLGTDHTDHVDSDDEPAGCRWCACTRHYASDDPQDDDDRADELAHRRAGAVAMLRTAERRLAAGDGRWAVQAGRLTAEVARIDRAAGVLPAGDEIGVRLAICADLARVGVALGDLAMPAAMVADLARTAARLALMTEDHFPEDHR